jgi:hypothetical protein
MRDSNTKKSNPKNINQKIPILTFSDYGHGSQIMFSSLINDENLIYAEHIKPKPEYIVRNPPKRRRTKKLS